MSSEKHEWGHRGGTDGSNDHPVLARYGSDYIHRPSGSYPMAVLQFRLEVGDRVEATGLDRLPHFHIRFSRFTEGRRAFLRRFPFPVEDPPALGAEMKVI